MDATAWTIISGLFGGIVILMLILYRNLKGDLDSASAQGKVLLEHAHAFEAFRAMDKKREEHWVKWQEDMEKRITAYESGTAAWRHNEISPALRRIEERLNTVVETVRHIEKRVDGK